MAEQVQTKTFINDFTQGPVLKAMVTFAFPLFLSNLLQAIYNVVDMVVVGRVVGQAGLSGLAIGGDMLSFLTFVSMGFSTACQTIIAQYIGAGWRDRLSRFIGTMSSFLMLCAVGISVICLLLRSQIMGWLNTPAESWDQAMAYSVTCMCGLVFIYGYNIVSAILRGMGDSKHPFVFISLAAVLNLLLDLLFVIVFRWEAFGAALATVIAQAVSFLTALVYLYHSREKIGFTLTLRHFRIDRAELGTLLKLGIPSAISCASIQISKLFINSWINSYGVTVSAVTGVGNKVDMFANQMCFAVATAGSSITGQNIGAGKYSRVTRVLGAAFFLNAISCAVMTAAMALFPEQVYGIFTDDAAVLRVCMEYLPISLLSFAASALRGAMNAFNLGCGNYKFNFAIAILDGIVGRIGFSLLLGLALGLGYFGFWMGSALAGLMPFFLGGFYFLTGWWKKTSSILQSE
ncbi:MAG: MATE family efflux transporter [Oscillospiraceae bacterium]